MAIVVKSGGNPSPALVGAYGGGQGRRWAEDARQQAAFAASSEEERKRRLAQQRESNLARKERTEEADRARAFSAEQAGQGRAFSEQEAALGRDFTLGRDKAGQERSLQTMRFSSDLREGSADADQWRKRQDVEWTYTMQQRQAHDRLTEALANLQADPDMTEMQKIEGADQIKAQLYNIKPVEKLSPKHMTPEERFKNTTTTLPDGTVIAFNPDGTAHKLVESPAIKQAKSRDKDIEGAIKQATEELNNKASNEGVSPPTTEEKLKRAEEIFKEKQAFRKLLTGGAEGAVSEPPITDADTPGYEALFGAGAKPNLAPSSATKVESLTEKDIEAINWAKANPKDPRSLKILKLNKE